MSKSGPGTTSKPASAQPDQSARSLSSPVTRKAKPGRVVGDPGKAPEPRRSALPKEEQPPDELQILFGKNLRAARLKCGLKQSEVAERTGLPQQYLSLIEAGQQNLTLKTMSALAAAVNHEVTDLLRKPTDLLPRP